MVCQERRISAYQLHTIDSVEDESSSSGKEDSSPESPYHLQPQAPQYGQYLNANGQVPHEGRSRTKKTKPRSKSLQPQSNIVPWRKATRPRRGRSLDKSPFLPGFKPEPVKSWTEETISLKPAPIEKKVIPKLEAAKVVLKSIKSQRDQGLESIGATLEKIIQGKTEKEAIPWITMREKLKQVEKVQQQLNKYDLDEVYLRPLEMPINTDQPEPQQATSEQIQRDREIQRLKSMESVEIMEMTEQIEKLMSQRKEDTIPWKEMRQHLKKVQRVHKEIEKFQIEEVELRHLEAQEIITQETQTATEETVVMMVDESSKGSIQKVIQKQDLQKYIEVDDIHKQQYMTTEDISMLSIQERERLQAQRLMKEQQALNWRHSREPQQYVQVEDTQMMHIQERQDTEEHSLTQPEPVMWDRGRKKPQKPQDYVPQPQQPQPTEQVQPKTYEEVHDELVEPTPVQKPEDLVPVMWERGKKQTVTQQQQVIDIQQTQQISEETKIVEETKKITQKRIIQAPQQQEKMEQVVLKPTPRQRPKQVQKEELQLQPLKRTQEVKSVEEQPTKAYEEVVDTLEEEEIKPQPQEELQPVMWERGKKKPTTTQEPQQPQKAYEEAVDELPEEPQQKPVEAPQPVLWERGKKKPSKVQETPVEEQPSKSYEEAVDELTEEPKPQQLEQQPVMWERGKKKTQQVQEQITQVVQTSEVTQVTEEQTVVEEQRIEEVKKKVIPKVIPQQKEEKVEQVQLKPTPRPKPKEKPKAEEIQLKPVKRTQPIKTQEVEEQPEKAYEEAVDTLTEEPEVQQPEQPQPVAWERGKKKKPVPQQVEEVTQEQPEKVYEEAVDTLPEQPEEQKPEQPQPVAWERGKKKKPQKPAPQEVEEPVQAYEETVDVLPEEPKEVQVEEPQPVMWQRGKKKPKKPVEEEPQPEEVVVEEEETVPVEEEEEEVKETTKVIKKKKVKKPKTKPTTEEEEIVEDETEIVEDIPQEEIEEVQPEKPEEPKRVKKILPQEPEKPEQVQLKPVPRKQLPKPQEEKIEQVTLKPRKKPIVQEETAQPEEAEIKEFEQPQEEIVEEVEEEVTKKRIKKKKPKKKPVEQEDEETVQEPEEEEVEEIEEVIPEEPVPEDIVREEETPKQPEVVAKPKPKPQPVEEKLEEVKLKPTRKPIKQLPQEETIEEVRLKPVKRGTPKPEEQQLEEVVLQHVEKLEDEVVVEEQKKVKKIKKPKHKDLPEIPDAEPVELETAEHIELEKEPKVEEPQPQVPWKRGEKKKPVEEPMEEKQWPTGKRRPLAEEQPEEVTLKPIPAKPKEEPQKPQKAVPAPEFKPEEKQPSEEKELEIEPVPVQEEEKPTKEKPKKKKKPKLQKGTPSVDEVSEEIAEPFAEPIAEEDQVEEIPIEDIKEVAVSEQVLPEEELVPTEELPTSKQKAHKKRTKRLKAVSFEEQPQLLEATVIDTEEIVQEEEISQEVSQKTILLNKKPEDTRPQFITTEQLIEVDVDEVKRNVEMKVTSNIVKKDRRRIVMDDSQPLPELELITQKRVQEGLDKVADEEVIEEEPIRQNEETTTAEVVEQTRKVVKKKKKEIKPPRITEKLRPRMCVPEEPTVLECKVEGIPFPEINWYFNDILLFASEKYELNVVEDVAQLKIAKVTPSDVGIYTCEAKNVGGIATTRTNIVLEKEQGIAPQFTKPLKIEFIEEKQPERLKVHVTCQVTGKPMPQVKWYRGVEEVIPSETVQMFYNEETGDIALEVINPTPNEAITYSVQAQNQFGRAIGNANILSRVDEQPKELLKAPTVTPLNALVIPHGGTLLFEAKYDGLPRPEIKWLRNGREIEINEDITIETTETTTTIKIINMNRKRTGKYEVCAKNKVGEVKSSGSVMVTDEQQYKEIKPPRFIKPLEPQYFGENEVAILEAIVESEPLSSFQWFVHNEPIKSSTECRIVTQANKSTLLIANFEKKYTGPYTCRAENVGGSVTSTATVHLLEDAPQEEAECFESPRFVEELIEPVEVMDGEALELNCKVVGKPTPKVEWYHNNEKIVENKETLIIQDAQGQCQLKITEVFPENDGEYKCVATNKVGETVTKTTVNIQAFEYIPDSEITGLSASEEDLLDKTISIDEQPPKIVKKLPEKIEPKEGELPKLEVKVIGKPKPKVKWLRDGEEIFASEEYQIENFEDGTSVLVINNVYPDDVGTISFEAHNPLGVAVTTALFSVEGIVGTKDYRKPEWVTHMEEMQKALKAAKCTPSLVNEMRDCRAATGEKAKFKIQFAGNPKPDIQWYYNNVQLRESDKYHMEVGESDASLTIMNITYEDIGYYTCKLINEIGMTMTRGKFDISTTATETEVTTKGRKGKGKKKVAKKVKPVIIPTAYTSSEEEEETKVETQIETTTIEIVPAASCETTMEVIKVRQPVSILVEQSEKSEEILVKDRKIADEELKTTTTIIEEKEEIITSTSVEISESVNILRSKIAQKSITAEDILVIRQHKEVNLLLETIEAESFGVIGESALRDLATMGLLIRHGCTILEIIYMYEQNIFISLKKPEAQSALVQLVEREGHEELISQILTESSTEDESILAATVGFKAFIRMIETCEITIETVIRKFVREDFITQDWKISGKERTVETTHVYESNEAVTHIKIEETFVEERTIIVEEGLQIEDSHQNHCKIK
ncbi:Titin [Lucilia cuprina]|nr:Titin [Lucilia cuprina]